MRQFMVKEPRAKILVIDDEDSNRYVIVRHLQRAGYEVHEAATGQEGICQVQQRLPDLVILDVQLPDAVGYDICRMIKKDPRTSSIPVLHVSATFQSSEDKVKGLDSGADGFLASPVEPAEFLAHVRLLLRLRAANQRLASVLCTIAEACFVVDSSWRILAVNRSAEETVFNRPAVELQGKGLWEELAMSPASELFEHLHAATADGEPRHFECHFEPLNKWFEVHACPRGSDLEVYLHDITQRKVAEQARAQLAAIVESSADAIYSYDFTGRILTWNPAAEKLFGWPAAEIIGQRMMLLAPADRVDEVMTKIVSRIQSGESLVSFETMRLRRDGTSFPVLLTASPLRDTAGKPMAISVIAHDITARKRRETALRESEERFRTMADGLPLMVWVHDAEGQQEFVNETFCEFFGVSREQMRGGHWQALMHPEDASAYAAEFFRCVRERRPFHAEVRVCNARGDWRCIESWGRPRFSAAGEFLGFVGTSADITERKEAEAALDQAQAELKQYATNLEQAVAERTARLRETIQALETFSYSMVHDMRAPLRSMQGFAKIVWDDWGHQVSEEAREYLQRICASASRLDHLIQDMLSYSEMSRRDLQMAAVNTERLLTEILESYPNLQRPDTRIELVKPLPVVHGNAAALTQVFSNLLDNAVKFVAPGVKPHVRVYAEENGETVRLWFEDNGIGIEQNARGKIFQMFERMVAPGLYDGTGIGLAIVHKAVDRIGGKVGVQSEPGKGSRFWVELRKRTQEPHAMEHATK